MTIWIIIKMQLVIINKEKLKTSKSENVMNDI